MAYWAPGADNASENNSEDINSQIYRLKWSVVENDRFINDIHKFLFTTIIFVIIK